jgi:hypothetical protein
MKFPTTLALLGATFTTLAQAQKDPDGYPACPSERGVVNVRGPLAGASSYLGGGNQGGLAWMDPETNAAVVQSTPEGNQKYIYAFFNYRKVKIDVGVEWHASPNVVRHSIYTIYPGVDCHINVGRPVTQVALYTSY